jgi:hypothetical protein
MTKRRIELEPRWQMHQTHERTICTTPGCYTFVVDRIGHLCLACRLDANLPPPRLGRPPKIPNDA